MTTVPLDGSCVDPVIFRMGANKPNKHALAAVVNRHNQPVFVPTYIEHRPIVGQNVRAAEHRFEINRPRPIRRLYHTHPRPERLLRVGSPWTIPKLSKCSHRDDPQWRSPL